MKIENKRKRRGNMVLPVLDDKNLAKDWRENDKKNLIGSLDRVNERERVLKAFEKVVEHVKTKDFKKLSTRFSIDPTAIEHRSKQIEADQNFNCNFDQSRNRFNRSKFWKKQIFKKQSNFM